MYKVVKNNGDVAYDVTEYTVDTVDDILTLPSYAGMGSKAYVIDSKELYIKNSKNEWKLVAVGGGNSGGGSEDTYVPITDESINSLFKEWDLNDY